MDSSAPLSILNDRHPRSGEAIGYIGKLEEKNPENGSVNLSTTAKKMHGDACLFTRADGIFTFLPPYHNSNLLTHN